MEVGSGVGACPIVFAVAGPCLGTALPMAGFAESKVTGGIDPKDVNAPTCLRVVAEATVVAPPITPVAGAPRLRSEEILAKDGVVALLRHQGPRPRTAGNLSSGSCAPTPEVISAL